MNQRKACPHQIATTLQASLKDQYEAGFHGTVLKNLFGITTREEIESVETAELWLAEEQLLGEITQDQAFTAPATCANQSSSKPSPANLSLRMKMTNRPVFFWSEFGR